MFGAYLGSRAGSLGICWSAGSCQAMLFSSTSPCRDCSTTPNFYFALITGMLEASCHCHQWLAHVHQQPNGACAQDDHMVFACM